jgi:hypothetical protein
MFRAAHRSSSGALNCTCSLWFIYPCGDQPLPRPSGKINFGIINSITKLHLVGISTKSFTMHGFMNIRFIKCLSF